MIKFLEVTPIDGGFYSTDYKILVNADKIIKIKPEINKEHTEIMFESGEVLRVVEPYDHFRFVLVHK